MILTSINRLSLVCWWQLLYSHYTHPLIPHRAQCNVLNGGSLTEHPPGTVLNDTLFQFPQSSPSEGTEKWTLITNLKKISCTDHTNINSHPIKYCHFSILISTSYYWRIRKGCHSLWVDKPHSPRVSTIHGAPVHCIDTTYLEPKGRGVGVYSGFLRDMYGSISGYIIC